MPPPIQAISFDAAGTLIHPAEPVGQTYARFGRLHGYAVDPDTLDRAFREAWRRAGPLHGDTPISSEDSDKSEKSWWQHLVAETFRLAGAAPIAHADALFEDLFHYFGTAEAWRLYPEVMTVLKSLASRYPIAVISNFDRRYHSVSLGLGISGFFSHILLSGELGAAKPSPRLFGAARDALNCPPETILHVGDDPIADWEGARACGFRVFELSRPAMSLRDLPLPWPDFSPGTFACAPSDPE